MVRSSAERNQFVDWMPFENNFDLENRQNSQDNTLLSSRAEVNTVNAIFYLSHVKSMQKTKIKEIIIKEQQIGKHEDANQDDRVQ